MFLDTGTDTKTRLVPRDLVTEEKNKKTGQGGWRTKTENDEKTGLMPVFPPFIVLRRLACF